MQRMTCVTLFEVATEKGMLGVCLLAGTRNRALTRNTEAKGTVQLDG